MTMGKQNRQTQSAFSITHDSDHILITLAIPKVIDVPYIGPTTIESISVAAATIIVPWLLWFGRRTVRRFQQYIKERKKKAEEPESPVKKAKKWETKNKKLEEFMNDEINPARQRLRKVGDPDTVEMRIAKRKQIKTEQAKKPKGKLGLSSELLQNSRAGLRQGDAPLDSYLNLANKKGKEDRSIDDELRMLEGHLEEDINTHAQLVKNVKARVQMVNGENDGDENKENVESANKCIIS